MSTKNMAPQRPKAGQRLRGHLRSAFIAGAITLIPLFITLFVLGMVYNFLTGPTNPLAGLIVEPVLGWVWRAKPPASEEAALAQWQKVASYVQLVLALVITLVTIYVLGVLSIFTIGRGILSRLEHFFENLPLIKGIYGTTKQVISVFRQGGGGAGFQRVVLVEFPRVGTYTIAFVTNTITDNVTNTKLVCCFIPMTPNPTSGFFQMFPESQVRDTDWTVDQGIKIVLSGGLLAPSQLQGAAEKASG